MVNAVQALQRYFGRKNSKAPKLSASSCDIPDLALSFGSWGNSGYFLAASRRGRGHEKDQTPRQDSFTVFETTEHLFFAVLDGVSSSPLSHVGANAISRDFENIIKRVFSTESIDSEKAWLQVNQDASKVLIRLFVKRCKDLGLEVPNDLIDVRENAADLYATTLQVVAIEKGRTNQQATGYVYANISGDGALFKIVTSRIFTVWPIEGILNNGSKSLVSALPASDKQPEVIRGSIPTGSYLVLCTDGVSDFLVHDKKWQKILKRSFRRNNPTYSDALDFISYNSPENFDDKTAIFFHPGK
jgi:serine/threonine protein phosphatase PrpC